MAKSAKRRYRQLTLWPTRKESSQLDYLRTLDSRIKRGKKLFKRLQFSRYHILPGTTQEVLAHPERYWRRVEKDGAVYYQPIAQMEVVHERLKMYFSRRARDESSTAYWEGSSILRNTEPHRHNRSSLSLDMRNAFESIETKHVYRYLCREKLLTIIGWGYSIPMAEFNRDEAWILSRLLTYRGRLRKGSPVSPFIFNLLCERIDGALRQVVNTFRGMAYTRYGDDLSFSSPDEVFPAKAEKLIRTVLSAHHIVLNENKTKRYARGIMEFPGTVVVDGRVRPRGEYIADLSRVYERMTLDERRGHRGFILQFGPRVPKILKQFL